MLPQSTRTLQRVPRSSCRSHAGALFSPFRRPSIPPERQYPRKHKRRWRNCFRQRLCFRWHEYSLFVQTCQVFISRFYVFHNTVKLCPAKVWQIFCLSAVFAVLRGAGLVLFLGIGRAVTALHLPVQQHTHQSAQRKSSRQRHHGRTFELRLQRDQRPPARTVAELHAPGTGPRTPAHHPFAHCQQRADAPQRGAVRSRTDLKHRDVLSGLRLFHAAVAAFMGFRRKS